MIMTFRRLAFAPSGSTSVMFAAFAAVITIGLLSMAKPLSHTMIAAIQKPMAVRY